MSQLHAARRDENSHVHRKRCSSTVEWYPSNAWLYHSVVFYDWASDFCWSCLDGHYHSATSIPSGINELTLPDSWQCKGRTSHLMVSVSASLFLEQTKIRAYRDRINRATDRRVKVTNEVLQGIRSIKMYGWEDSFVEFVSIKNVEFAS